MIFVTSHFRTFEGLGKCPKKWKGFFHRMKSENIMWLLGTTANNDNKADRSSCSKFSEEGVIYYELLHSDEPIKGTLPTTIDEFA